MCHECVDARGTETCVHVEQNHSLARCEWRGRRCEYLEEYFARFGELPASVAETLWIVVVTETEK